MVQKVIIIGHGFTSRLSIIRSLAQIGCEMTIVVMTGYKKSSKTLNTRKPIDCYSKYVNHVYFNRRSDGEGLIRLLLDKCVDPYQKAILFPDSDFSAAIIDDNKEILSPHFLFPFIARNPHSVRFWMNKENQKSLASDIGLNYAKSVHVKVSNDGYILPEGIRYPCFTKPVITISGGKQFFFKCENEQELRAWLNRAVGNGEITILIEDFIKIKDEYAVLGFSDGNNVIIPGVIRFIENSRSHFGIALKGQILPVAGFESLIDQFKQYVVEMGFVGVFDIDFFFGDNKWWFGEMNLRFGGSGYAVTKMGVNLPAMLVKSLRGENIDSMSKEVKGTATYVNDRMCLDDWYGGYISTHEYYHLINTSDIVFVNDSEDKGPQREFNREYRIAFIRRAVKKLLGRV